MTSDDQLPDEQPAIRIVARPTDTNAGGDIFGGWIMSQIDIAGSIAAYREAGGRVVTIAVDSMQFHQPIFVGDLVSCYSRIEKIGNSSIQVHVDVYVERDRQGIQVIKVTEARLTYVAIDENRRPRPVHPD